MASDPELRAHQEWLGYLQPVGLVVSPPGARRGPGLRQPRRGRAPARPSLDDLVDPARRACVNDFPGFCRTFLGWEPGAPGRRAGRPAAARRPRRLPAGVRRGPVADLRRPGPRPRRPVADARPGPRHGRRPRRRRGRAPGERPRLARQPAGPLRAPAARARGPDRPPLERHAPAPRLRAARRVLRPRHVPGRRDAARCRAGRSSARCTCCSRPSASSRPVPDEAAPPRPPARQPQVPERGLDAARRPGAGGPPRAAARLPGRRRGEPAASCCARCSASARRTSTAASSARSCASSSSSTPRTASCSRAATRSTPSTTPSAASSRACATTTPASRTPWTSATAPGRGSSPSSASSTTAPRTAACSLPARHGRLFDPDAWDFLEGRPYDDVARPLRQRLDPPRVSDGVVYRVLENLLVLDGERLSYRALDVEQIGSVYEAMMGFELRVAEGPSIGVKPDHVVVDLARAARRRSRPSALKRLKDEAELRPHRHGRGRASRPRRRPDDARRGPRQEGLAAHAAPSSPRARMFLQPTDERRRSGSHYTPRSLTEPIVRTTLEPDPRRTSATSPRAEQILDLKVCDPAMGSGAFLVEACRYLGDALVQGLGHPRREAPSPAGRGPPPLRPPPRRPALPLRRRQEPLRRRPRQALPLARHAGERPPLHLPRPRPPPRRLARRPHPRADRELPLGPEAEAGPDQSAQFLDEASSRSRGEARRACFALGDSDDHDDKATLHAEAVEATDQVRDAGDLVIAAFFGAEKDKQREALPLAYRDRPPGRPRRGRRPRRTSTTRLVDPCDQAPSPSPRSTGRSSSPRSSRERTRVRRVRRQPAVSPARTRSAPAPGDGYPDWLKVTPRGSARQHADLVAHFFRRAFGLLRDGGTFGLIATNTIAQGDTRASGLRWICTHGGTIYAARKRVKWPAPGAAVIVSVVHVAKAAPTRSRPAHPAPPYVLDGRPVDRITAFLFHDGGHEDPARLAANAGRSFNGSYRPRYGLHLRRRQPRSDTARRDGAPDLQSTRATASGSSRTSAARRSTTAPPTPIAAT